jgi:RNA recognition motif-containing protein
MNKVFVGNVPYNCSEEEFNACFSNINGFISSELVNKNNPYATDTRGFGFVLLDSIENINKLIETEIKLKGRTLRFSRYSNDDKEIINNNYIQICNIPSSFTKYDILNMFYYINKQYIGRCFIASNMYTGELLNYGVIQILDEDEYKKIINMKIVQYKTYVFNVCPFLFENMRI